MICRKKFIYVFIAVSLALSSCLKLDIRDVLGSYEYKYPFGDIEIIKLNVDGTLDQAFYFASSQIETASPYLSNRGKWTIRGGSLEFEDVYFISSWPNRSARRIPPKLMSFWRGCYFDRVDGRLVIRFTDESDDFYSKL